MHDYDVITRRTVFRNVDTRPRNPFQSASACSGDPAMQHQQQQQYGTDGVSTSRNKSSNASAGAPLRGNNKVVQKASSMSIDFEATSNPFHVVQLNGR